MGWGPGLFQSELLGPSSVWHIKLTSFYENHCILRNRVCLYKAILKYVFLQFLNRDHQLEPGLESSQVIRSAHNLLPAESPSSASNRWAVSSQLWLLKDCYITQRAQSALCDDLEGAGWEERREIQEGGDTCIIITDLHCYTAETNTTL